MKLLRKRDFFTLGYMALIFIVSSIQNPPQPKIDIFFLDKWEHIIEYSIFGFLVFNSLNIRLENKLKKLLIFAICISFVTFYGMTDEFHQYFVPTRSCDVTDLMADFTGGIVGSLIFIIVNRFILRKKSAK